MVIWAELIKSLKEYIRAEFAEHIVVENETIHSLLISFYGLKFNIRIEIGWKEENLNPAITTYSLSYSTPPVETCIGVCQYDDLGNVHVGAGAYAVNEFPAPLLEAVFTYTNSQGSNLRR